MGNSKNNLSNFIIKAIDKSIEFEQIMDSIDFNSYLPEEKDDDIKSSSLYKNYIEKLGNASNICKGIISISEIEKRESDHNNQYVKDKELCSLLIENLFEVKEKRIETRKQTREMEEKYYIENTYKLHTAFLKIPEKDWSYSYGDKNLEDKDLLDDYSWAKILYYNELAICYSGLIKSSMSLGYAEESIFILEKLYSDLKSIENPADDTSESGFNNLIKKFKRNNNFLTVSHVIKLYTFALYNKGEAERLLGETDSALKTFKRIIEIYRKSKEKGLIASLTDYNLALLKRALILNDQGRGQEAIDCLKILEIDCKDYRVHERYLETASALIDQKKYEDVWDFLNRLDYRSGYTCKQNEYGKALEFLDIFTKKDFEDTYIQRQVKIRKLYLMNEFKKNRPKDYYSDKEASLEIMEIKDEYKNFKKIAEDLMVEAGKRKDGDSFKGACTNLAEFYRLEIGGKKDFQKALKCFYLYLFEKKIFSNESDDISAIIHDWLNDSKDIVSLLEKYNEDIKTYSSKKLENNNDENYLRKFFDVYIDEFIESENFLKKMKNQKDTIKDTIKKLNDRLIDIYYQKDEDINLEQITIKFEQFDEKFGSSRVKKWEIIKRGKNEKFIEDHFFREKEGMHIDNIANQMNQNTTNFIKNIIGTSIIPNENKNKIQGTLSILRRWNSFTPTLSSSINQSKGGGYFLRFSYNNNSYGIVIDPGYDFLKNFFSQGFIVQDIDLILVSHVHPDHVDNLAAILSLFHEMNGRLGKYHYQEKKINKKYLTLVVSSGVFEHYNPVIRDSFEILKDIIVVNGKNGFEQVYIYDEWDKEHTIEIYAFGTTHKDLSQFQSLGFIISAKNNDGSKAVIGYTGDIKWRPDNTNLPKYLKHFKECNIVCAHLGSIVNILNGKDFCNTFCENFEKNDKNNMCLKHDECREFDFKRNLVVTKEKLMEQVGVENHLYLAGLTMFFDELLKSNNLKLAIISEFGEELMHGIRMDLYKKFNNWFQEIYKGNPKPICLVGDIGLETNIFTGEVYCHCCKRFVDRAKIEPIPYGKEEAICFVCEECKSVLSVYQIDHILKDYYRNGRKLDQTNILLDDGE